MRLFSILIILASLCFNSYAQETHEDIFKIEIYSSHSDTDMQWFASILKDAKRIAGEKVEIELLDIDNTENYKYLRIREKEEGISQVSKIVAFSSFSDVLEGKAEIEAGLLPLIQEMISEKKMTHVEIEDAITKVYKIADRIEQVEDTELRRVFFRDKVIGYAHVFSVSLQCGVCIIAEFMVRLTPDGYIQDIVPLNGIELQGSEMSSETYTPFLNAFVGCNNQNALTFDGMTGATKTSDAYKQGASTTLLEYKSIKQSTGE